MATAPSLRSLQAFEASARLGSFAAAADELAVSPAAISQLVRGLESYVGKQLFRRANRSVSLTEAGLEVLPKLSSAFEELSDVSRQLSGTRPRVPLTISAPPSMTTGWLSVKIASFMKDYALTDLSIRSEEDPVDFDRDLIDIRISYGPFPYLKHQTEEILVDHAIPVCSPEFLEREGPFDSLQALARKPLIHTDWGPAAAAFPSWGDLLLSAAAPVSRDIDRGIVVNSSHGAINLAIGGVGIALGQGILATLSIEDGRLVRPFVSAHRLGQPYGLTIRQRSAERPVVVAFREWIMREIRNCAQSIHL